MNKTSTKSTTTDTSKQSETYLLFTLQNLITHTQQKNEREREREKLAFTWHLLVSSGFLCRSK